MRSEKEHTVSIDFENGVVTHEGNEYHFLDFPKAGLRYPGRERPVPTYEEEALQGAILQFVP